MFPQVLCIFLCLRKYSLKLAWSHSFQGTPFYFPTWRMSEPWAPLWVNCECTLSIIQWMLIWVANKEHKRSAKWTVNARWTIFECKMYNLFGVPSSWELSWHWILSVIRKKIANKLVHVHVHCRSHESWQNNSILSYSRIQHPILQNISILSYPILSYPIPFIFRNKT